MRLGLHCIDCCLQLLNSSCTTVVTPNWRAGLGVAAHETGTGTKAGTAVLSAAESTRTGTAERTGVHLQNVHLQHASVLESHLGYTKLTLACVSWCCNGD